MTNHVAVDVGSSSGAVFLGTVASDALRVEEVHRFDSGLLSDGEARVWDLDHLLGEIGAGLERAAERAGRLDSVGIDATAGGFGFVADGAPIRDPAREGSAVPEGISERELFFETGHRRLPSAYYYLARERPQVIERADALLLLPQLLAHQLGAGPHGELTYAVSAGLGNTLAGSWSTGVLDAFDLPTDVLPPMRSLGSDVGALAPRPSADLSLDLDGDPRIRVVAGHDTSSAVAAVPFADASKAFLATGSWFIPGFERAEAVVTDSAFEASAENLGGVDGTVRFVRNLPGFSLLERFRERWRERGRLYAYDRLREAARAAPARRTLVATTDGRLRRAHAAGGVGDALCEYCEATDQPVPEGEGEITRCLLESLAVESAVVLARLGAVAGEDPDRLHLVGGGARNPLLCRFVADATGLPVRAGPAEATAVGNLLVQAAGAGTLDVAAGRNLLADQLPADRYEPRDPGAWDDARERMAALLDG